LRFTTYERLQRSSFLVIKKDGRREEFNREKLLAGIRKACDKRPLESGTVERLVDELEGELYQSGRAEVLSSDIGDLVMLKLKKTDHIAYIRFASVYREFEDITTLKAEVDNLAGRAPLPPADQLPLFKQGELPVQIPKSRRRAKR
jgi:transcriptional repressor NrdR